MEPQLRGLRSTLLLAFALALLSLAGLAQSGFTERLDLKALPHGRTLFEFAFEVTGDDIPGTMHDLASSTHLRTYAMHLTRGRWRRDWDSAGATNPYPAPIGGEIWAQFDDVQGDVEGVHWHSLVNSLSGIYCTSLSLVTDAVTSRPTRIFNGSHYAQLPREGLCTENLTPWSKLLPCRLNSGLASLLRSPPTLFASEYVSLGSILTVDLHLDDGGSDSDVEVDGDSDATVSVSELKKLKLQQTVALVLKTQGHDSPCTALGIGIEGDGGGQLRQCDAVSTQATAAAPATGFGSVVVIGDGGVKKPSSDVCSIALPVFVPGNDHGGSTDTGSGSGSTSASTAGTGSVHVDRLICGVGQERGSIVSRIHSSYSHAVTVDYLDRYPPFIRPMFHTLSLNTSANLHFHAVRIDTSSRASLLELGLTLNPHSTVELSLDFNHAFLHYADYPPDANRGFDLPPAAVAVTATTVNASASGDRRGAAAYSQPVLVAGPSPDFSMMYNVVTITCTVVALMFGSMFNALTT